MYYLRYLVKTCIVVTLISSVVWAFTESGKDEQQGQWQNSSYSRVVCKIS